MWTITWWINSVIIVGVYGYTTKGASLSRSNYCYADDPHPYNYFSSKTPYKEIYNSLKFEPPPEQCTPISLWILVRHGIRYSSKRAFDVYQEMEKIQELIVHNHKVLKRGKLCDKDVENLKKWKWKNIPAVEGDQLTPGGYAEIVEIARRYRNRFPEIFDKNFSPEYYKFQHTDHVKNRRTAIAFAEGIFGSKLIEDKREEICPKSKSDDLLVQLYPECKDDLLFENDEFDLLQSKSEFQNSSYMENVIKNVSKRLGFSEILPFQVIDSMYNLCRYSKAWYYSELSPWCALFSKDDMKVLEYMNDLAYYYNSGPGLEINKRFGCPLLQDMIHQFQDAVRNETGIYYKGKFYFGHSTTLFNLLAKLGTHVQSEHITANNYDTMQNRKWKTSLIDPFGSNFAAVLLRCNDTEEKYKIMFYHNEQPFVFKECNGSICDWNQFYEIYKDEINPEICHTDYCKDSIWTWIQNEMSTEPTDNNADSKNIKDSKEKETDDMNHSKILENNDNDKINKEHTKNNVNQINEKQQKVEIDNDTESKQTNKLNKIDELNLKDNLKKKITKLDKEETSKIFKTPNSESNSSYTLITLIIFILLFFLMRRLCCRRKRNGKLLLCIMIL